MTTATELKSLLKQFNNGVQKVSVQLGIVSVYVSSAKAAYGVTLDLMRSRAFSSVRSIPNAASGKGFIVHAVPA